MSIRLNNTTRAQARVHEKVRRQALAALDTELAKLQRVTNSTDAKIIGLNERGKQLEELHRLRYKRLDLFTDDLSPRQSTGSEYLSCAQ
jgi:flagellar motility protein MotE (MotC chaperone)